MKIYKWVPISTLDQVYKKIIWTENKIIIKTSILHKSTCFILQKKKGKTVSDKENGLPRKGGIDSSNSNFGLTEDSNTCEFGFNDNFN